jgi:hypothetical protein
VNKKTGDTSIRSQVENCMKISSEELQFLPCAICSNCRNRIMKCEDPSKYPIRVKYAELIENVKTHANKNEIDYCICEICLLGSDNDGGGGCGRKTQIKSQFLLSNETNFGGRPATKHKLPKITDYYGESKESTKKQKVQYIYENTDKGQAHNMFSQILCNYSRVRNKRRDMLINFGAFFHGLRPY